jgi:hypothetical protein
MCLFTETAKRCQTYGIGYYQSQCFQKICFDLIYSAEEQHHFDAASALAPAPTSIL